MIFRKILNTKRRSSWWEIHRKPKINDKSSVRVTEKSRNVINIKILVVTVAGSNVKYFTLIPTSVQRISLT